MFGPLAFLDSGPELPLPIPFVPPLIPIEFLQEAGPFFQEQVLDRGYRLLKGASDFAESALNYAGKEISEHLTKLVEDWARQHQTIELYQRGYRPFYGERATRLVPPFLGGQSYGVLYRVEIRLRWQSRYVFYYSWGDSCRIGPIETTTIHAEGVPGRILGVQHILFGQNFCNGLNPLPKTFRVYLVFQRSPTSDIELWNVVGGDNFNFIFFESQIISIVRTDGQPDTGGNPPATVPVVGPKLAPMGYEPTAFTGAPNSFIPETLPPVEEPRPEEPQKPKPAPPAQPDPTDPQQPERESPAFWPTVIPESPEPFWIPIVLPEEDPSNPEEESPPPKTPEPVLPHERPEHPEQPRENPPESPPETPEQPRPTPLPAKPEPPPQIPEPEEPDRDVPFIPPLPQPPNPNQPPPEQTPQRPKQPTIPRPDEPPEPAPRTVPPGTPLPQVPPLPDPPGQPAPSPVVPRPFEQPTPDKVPAQPEREVPFLPVPIPGWTPDPPVLPIPSPNPIIDPPPTGTPSRPPVVDPPTSPVLTPPQITKPPLIGQPPYWPPVVLPPITAPDTPTEPQPDQGQGDPTCDCCVEIMNNKCNELNITFRAYFDRLFDLVVNQQGSNSNVCEEPCIEEILDDLEAIKQDLEELKRRVGNSEALEPQTLDIPYVSETVNQEARELRTLTLTVVNPPPNALDLLTRSADLALTDKPLVKPVRRIYNILGGDSWEFDENNRPRGWQFTPESVILEAVQSLYNPQLTWDGDRPQVLATNNEIRVLNILDFVVATLAVAHFRSGLWRYPSEVQGGLISLVDDFPPNEQLQDLTRPRIFQDVQDFRQWQLEQFDAILGHWQQVIEIEDTDPLQPGQQKSRIVIPNLSEAVTELLGQLVVANINLKALLKMGVTNLIETVGARKEAIATQFKTDAIIDYLGFPIGERGLDLNILITLPEELSADSQPSAEQMQRWDNLERFLRPSKKKIPIVEFAGGKTNFQTALLDLLQAAAIVKAHLTRKLPKSQAEFIKQIKDLLGLLDQDELAEEWKKFIEQVEMGWSADPNLWPGTTQNKPYNRPPEERPRIIDLNPEDK